MSSSDSTCCDLVCAFFSTVLGLGIAAGYVAYIVFGIMYLVEDYHVANDCAGSALWAYVLVGVILSYSRVSGAKQYMSEDDSSANDPCAIIMQLFCYLLIEIGLAAWGGTELYDKACPSLAASHIWKFALATFSLNLIAIGLILLIPLVVYCVSSSKRPTGGAAFVEKQPTYLTSPPPRANSEL